MELTEAYEVLQKRPRVFGVDEMRVVRQEGEPTKLRGHAAVFNEWTELWPGTRERVAPGAFKKTLEEGADVRALWNHDSNIVLGRTKSKTLKLSEDTRGLAVEITPPDTSFVRDVVLAPIERGDVDGMSFGFFIRGREEERNEEWISYTLMDVDLNHGDVSPVTYPQYQQTDISQRALDAIRRASERQREEALATLRERGAIVIDRMLSLRLTFGRTSG